MGRNSDTVGPQPSRGVEVPADGHGAEDGPRRSLGSFDVVGRHFRMVLPGTDAQSACSEREKPWSGSKRSRCLFPCAGCSPGRCRAAKVHASRPSGADRVGSPARAAVMR